MYESRIFSIDFVRRNNTWNCCHFSNLVFIYIESAIQRKLYSGNISLCFSEEEGKIQIEQQIEKISLKMSQMGIEGSPAQSSYSEGSDVSEAGNSTVVESTRSSEDSRSSVAYDITDDSGACGNVKHSNGNDNSEMIFLPQLKELTHLIKASERTDIQEELVRSVEKFKRASDEYKKTSRVDGRSSKETYLC